MLRMTSQIQAWHFDAINLRLGPNLHYRPDFFVVYPDRCKFVEIKGFLRDDARVKFITATQTYPYFDWVMIKAGKGDPSTWKVMYEN